MMQVGLDTVGNIWYRSNYVYSIRVIIILPWPIDLLNIFRKPLDGMTVSGTVARNSGLTRHVCVQNLILGENTEDQAFAELVDHEYFPLYRTTR